MAVQLPFLMSPTILSLPIHLRHCTFLAINVA